MSKNAKFLLLLIIISLGILGFLLFTARLQRVDKLGEGAKTGSQQTTAKVDMEQLKSTYQQEARKIVGDYDLFLAQLAAATTSPDTGADDRIARTRAMKERLLSLTVPTEFKDLHLNLILSLSDVEQYLADDSAQGMAAGQELLAQAKAENSWLNN